MSLSDLRIGSWNVIGGHASFGMAYSSRPIFVDKVNGSDENVIDPGIGNTPETAQATVEGALTHANAQDVIYIAPGGAMSDGDPVAYRSTAANHLIAAGTYGLAVVGLTHSGLIGFPMDPQIKLSSTVTTTPIMRCFAPYCAFENLAFNSTGDTSISALAFESGETATSNANNISVYNCYFRNAGCTAAQGNSGGAIYIIGGMGFNIQHCMFYNCRVGIAAKSSTATCEGLYINDVTFLASNANKISSDIYMYFQGQNFTHIDNVKICHDVPSYSGGNGACIMAAQSGTIGLVARVWALDTDGSVNATTGTIARVPTTMGTAMIYNGDGSLVNAN